MTEIERIIERESVLGKGHTKDLAKALEQYVIKARIEENKVYLDPYIDLGYPQDTAKWRIEELKKSLKEAK